MVLGCPPPIARLLTLLSPARNFVDGAASIKMMEPYVDIGLQTNSELLRLLPRMNTFVLMKRLGRPEEIADAVLWLFSDKASYVTGQSISVNGG